MRVALYQCPPLPLDVAGNLQRLQAIVLQAKDNVDLLVLPEMFLTGYNIGAKAVAELAQAQDGNAAQQIAELAKANNMAIVYGYPEHTEDGHIYNSVQLIDAHGQRLCNYRKTHLFGELDRTMFSQGPEESTSHYTTIILIPTTPFSVVASLHPSCCSRFDRSKNSPPE